MAKIYGDRWEIEKSLGQGGQGDVYIVRDVTGTMSGRFALKRVRNPKRIGRFSAEVRAIKSLSHPNIINLVDHSAIDDEMATTTEKQYLVMPIAEGGDLSAHSRRSLYTGAIDGVLLVAKQIASALKAAHDANIVHRDVKPQNILFTGNGHEVLLTDFGICLIRDSERHTEVDEVAGPRVFIAPELEHQGPHDATPAADIYSLGKVIYYMISGGTLLPREDLDAPEYAAAFKGGQRYALLHDLLRRMICPLASRMKNMNEVLSALEHIEQWEDKARLVAASPAALSAWDRLREKAHQHKKIITENQAARDIENLQRTSIETGIEDWLYGELSTLAGTLKPSDPSVSVEKTDDRRAIILGANYNHAYRTMCAVDLLIDDGTAVNRQHKLRMFICELLEPPRVTVTPVGQQQKVFAQPVVDL